MKFPVLKKENEPRQNALSMEQYADFVEFFLEDASPENARAQKMREEHITIPFSITGRCSVQNKFPASTVKQCRSTKTAGG